MDILYNFFMTNQIKKYNCYKIPLFWSWRPIKFKWVITTSKYNVHNVPIFLYRPIKFKWVITTSKYNGHTVLFFESRSIKFKWVITTSKYNGHTVPFFCCRPIKRAAIITSTRHWLNIFSTGGSFQQKLQKVF